MKPKGKPAPQPTPRPVDDTPRLTPEEEERRKAEIRRARVQRDCDELFGPMPKPPTPSA